MSFPPTLSAFPSLKDGVLLRAAPPLVELLQGETVGGATPIDLGDGSAPGSGLALEAPSLRGWAALNGGPGYAQNPEGEMPSTRQPRDTVEDMLDAANTLNVLSTGGGGGIQGPQDTPEISPLPAVESAPAVAALPGHLQTAPPLPHLFSSPTSQATLSQLLLSSSPYPLPQQGLAETTCPAPEARTSSTGAPVEPAGLDDDVAAAFSGL